MKIFDSHCHYNLSPLLEDWQTHWNTSQEHGIIGSIVVGTDLETSREAISIAKQATDLFPAVGIHPGHWQLNSNQDMQQVMSELELILQKNEVQAFGETGLDYFRMPADAQEAQNIQEIQKNALIMQLEMVRTFQKKKASDAKLPVILHVRDTQTLETATPGNAYWDVINITQKYSDLQFILHCVSGPQAYVRTMIERGAFVSVAANCTYPSAQSIRDLVSLIPSEKILIETDAPFLPPQGFRGKQCEPWMITLTMEYLATHFGVTEQQLLANTQSCFGIPLNV